MKFTTTLLASSAIIGAGTLAFADAHADMAKEMTLVSWGGAYQASQDKAYLPVSYTHLTLPTIE